MKDVTEWEILMPPVDIIRLAVHISNRAVHPQVISRFMNARDFESYREGGVMMVKGVSREAGRGACRPLSRLFACLTLVLVSCSDIGSDPDFSSIADPYERWKAYRIRDYSIIQRRYCFCPDANVPFTVIVRNDKIESVINATDGSVLPEQERRLFKSVDELFDIIETVSRDTVARFDVEYDGRYGYPSYIFVDPSLFIADEEYGYRTEDLTRSSFP